MDRDYEAKYHVLEDRHWWFRGRRDLVLSLVLQYSPARSSRILEIGCSSGALLQRLAGQGYDDTVGIDVSVKAVTECERRGLANAMVMDARKLDFPDASFDMVTASDVLEHIDEDALALREWHRVLKPGGVAIIFVPAFRSLWSEHDLANHHFRRYRLGELEKKVRTAGLALERSSYWNSALFLPIAAVRGIRRAWPARKSSGIQDGDLSSPPRPMNWLLYHLLHGENIGFCAGMNYPFGVSAMVVARRPGAA